MMAFAKGVEIENIVICWLQRMLEILKTFKGSCQFRPMASPPPPSSPPHRLNSIEFAPNQIESHIEIIPRSFIHCLIRLLVARKLCLVESTLVARLPRGEMTCNRWTLLLCAREQANNHLSLSNIHRLKWFFENIQ